MSDKKKRTGLKAVLGIVGSFFAANVAGVAYLTLSAAKKAKNTKSGNNMMYSVAMGKKKLEVKPDTDRAYINCVTGVTEIEINELPSKNMDIELGAFCSVFALKLPAGLKVEIEGTGHRNVINNLYGEAAEENLPTVHINVNKVNYSAVNVVKTGATKEYIECK